MNITFLFGAGASANAIPVLSELPRSINEFVNKISNKEFDLSNYEKGASLAPEKIKELLIQDMKWLLAETKKTETIDEVAFELFKSGKIEKLNRLKLALTVYLTWQQILNPADYRYKIFLDSFLKGGHYSFQSNVKVLTWNYDFQLEKSYGLKTKNYSLHQNSRDLNVLSKFDNLDEFDEKRFGIIKLNGTTNLIKKDGTGHYVFIDSIEKEPDKNMLERLLVHYPNIIQKESTLFPGISYAWEKQDGENEIVSAAMKATSETEILVVIGYSFPDVNINVDEKIINNMKHLKKIYYQVPNAIEKVDELKNKLFLSNTEIYPEAKTDVFFIPKQTPL